MSAEPQIELSGAPFKGKRRLYNVVPVQLRTNFIKVEYDAGSLLVHPGDQLIVETDKGPVIGKVTGQVTRKVLKANSLQRVVRKASEQDIERADKNEELEVEAHHFAVQRIRERALPMKLIRAQYMQDGSRIVFYFSADGRIDFRDLVKDLAHRFRTRIEMHQIGVRDGTRMIGGIGPCGRELCCSTFLENFAPVSIRMAKDQGLTLNPAKVSGMCGRLMCCLVYEQQVYRRMRKRLPRAGQRVETPDGLGKVLELDVINQRVIVELEDTNRRTYENADVMLHDPKRGQTPKAEEPPSDYLWDDLDPKKSDDESKGKKRRRRRRGGKSKGSDGQNQQSNQTQSSDNNLDKPKKSRNRRRRRGGKGSGNKSEGQGQGQNQKNDNAKKDSKQGDSAKKSGSRRRRRGRGKGKGGSNQGGSDNGGSGKGGSDKGGSKKE